MKDLVLLLAVCAGALVGGAVFAHWQQSKQPIKPCPGEVVSMVIDKDGTVLCTYMLVPQGVVKETRKMK